MSPNDWRLYQRLNPVQKGWGERGVAVHLDNDEDKALAKEQFKSGAFDVFISDRISPNRTLQDARPYECSKVDYPSDGLGSATIVIIYTNEIWSALIRTIWSVTTGWLEPLLARIVDDLRDVICPVIDVISDKTLEFFAGNPYYVQDAARKAPTRAVVSPTMAGGFFAIDPQYFFEIGSYDERMEIWGGENLELSFRVWQCGGRLEIHPCSHVGHIFRDYHPYSFQGKDT
ncbi:unnamed protein product, partial [Medioppia subpectinata]